MRETKPPQPLGDILAGIMPSGAKGRACSSSLRQAWRKAAGDALAERARPVCIVDEGVLVVAVRGSVWQQEIRLAANQLTVALAEQGFAIDSLRVVQAATEPPAQPEPQPVELTLDEHEQVAAGVASVVDRGLRKSLASAMAAQLRVAKSLQED